MLGSTSGRAARIACLAARDARRVQTMSGDAIRWPAEVSEEVARLHAEMMAFGQELRTQLFGPTDSGFDQLLPGQPPELAEWYRLVWRPFVNDWLSFHAWHDDSFWQNLPLSGSWDKVQEFRKKFIDLDREARAHGFRILKLPPDPPKKDPDLTKDLTDAVKAALLVLGVGGGLLLVATAASRFGSKKRDSVAVRISEPRRATLALSPPGRGG